MHITHTSRCKVLGSDHKLQNVSLDESLFSHSKNYRKLRTSNDRLVEILSELRLSKAFYPMMLKIRS